MTTQQQAQEIINKRNELEKQRTALNEQVRLLSQQIWEIDEALKDPVAIDLFIQKNLS